MVGRRWGTFQENLTLSETIQKVSAMISKLHAIDPF